MNDQTGFQLPGSDHPLWSAIKSLLAVAAGALGLAWRERRVRKRERTEGKEPRDMVWDQASQVRLEYIELLKQANLREASMQTRLLEREREIFIKDDIISDLRIKEASRAARHNALVRRIQAEGDQGDDLQIWPETNGHGHGKEGN